MIRTFFRCVAWGLAPVTLYLVLAFVGALVPASGADGIVEEPREREIVLARGVIHYDILLPLDDDTRGQFSFLDDTRVPLDAGEWLSVGWGSEAFYTSAGAYTDITWGALVKAITYDRSVIRFEVYGALPDHPDLKRVSVSDDQLDALRQSIFQDLDLTGGALEAEGFSETDAFFPAQGAFHLLKTCNVWVGRTLRAAGIDFGIWTPTPYAVTLAARINGLLSR